MKRSKYSLSHTHLTTMDMGQLVPVACYEVLPGDTIQAATTALIRCNPLVAPVMHPVHVRVHHFFVPNRLIWDEWEQFITGGEDGLDDTEMPYLNPPAGGYQGGTLGDYLGVPPGVDLIDHSALPFRAYQLIWQEYFRDQDLAPKPNISKASGLDTTTDVVLRTVSWQKDYFTTARPWAQKGPDISIPQVADPGVLADQQFGITAAANTGTKVNVTTDATGHLVAAGLPNDTSVFIANNSLAISNLPIFGATGVPTINDLREAFAIQRFTEARARYGSRYTEYLRYLGVKSSDARLQRPEYLGGGRQTIQFSEVLQTGPNDPTNGNVIGGMFGHGITGVRSNRFRRFFEEHGIVLSLMSVLPKTMYTQGLSKMWYRMNKEDYFQKELQHIGQQEVLNKEIYAAHTDPNGVFGYQDRYDDYRRKQSRVSSLFRTTMKQWHFGREFATPPVLNYDFIRAIPTKEPFADQQTHTILAMCANSIQARRLVSNNSTPYVR